MSINNGAEVRAATDDHKPQLSSELSRILAAGGSLYRASYNPLLQCQEQHVATSAQIFAQINTKLSPYPKLYVGPWRVKPGSLSVSRTFGDAEAKIETLGGKSGVISPHPFIYTMNNKDVDFVALCCDGIFDVLSNEDVSQIIWETVRSWEHKEGDHECGWAGEAAKNVVKKSMIDSSEDNLTVVIVAFKDLHNAD